MSLTIGPAFTIAGYTTTAPPDYDIECEAIVYAADGLVEHPAFWLHYLSGPVGAYPEAGAAFEISAAEYQAMCAVLDDPQRWPVVSVQLDREAWLRIVYRNFEDDEGVDFVEQQPDRPVKVFDLIHDRGESTMTWADLLAVAQLPDERLSWTQRFILMLPMLDAQELPTDAEEVMLAALEGIGATNRLALAAVVLERLDWRTH